MIPYGEVGKGYVYVNGQTNTYLGASLTREPQLNPTTRTYPFHKVPGLKGAPLEPYIP